MRAPLTTRQRLLVLLIAVAGIGLSSAAVIHFLLAILWNRLDWAPGLTVREHYLAVGSSYSQGFVAGFFLAFSLSVAAVAVGTWSRRRRADAPDRGRRRSDRAA